MLLGPRGLAVVLLATLALYLPGMRGGFLFDDFPNIVDNTALHVRSLNLADCLRAAWASPSSDMQRPLASLSFALNHYFTGLAPAPMKLVNIGIHLLNGALLFVLLQRLLRLLGLRQAPATAADSLPLLVTATWLLHPINLSGVLYVVQRMESLAQVFVLIGLTLYTDARLCQLEGRPGANWRLWLAFPACLALGVAAKESAILLPLYAFVLELALIPRRSASGRHPVRAFFAFFLVLPGLLGVAWLLPRVLSPAAYASRTFTLGERLLTEPRVLVDYATSILAPIPQFFSFYRDDLAVSTGPWHPWTTMPAIALLLAISALAWRLRHLRPLFALGWGWFLAGHALTATVIPLELAFEHRNYFASIGLLMAALDWVVPADGCRHGLARAAAVAALLALATLTLALRVNTWANPVKLAVTEAALHPDSPRATYELARTHLVLSKRNASELSLQRAMESLESAAKVPKSGILPDVGLIMSASRSGLPVSRHWWERLVTKLRSRPPSAEDASALATLTECQRNGSCALEDRAMIDAYTAAASHQPPNPSVLYSYAIYAHNRLGDTELALRLVRDAARSGDPQYRVNLINFLIDIGRREEAASELDALQARVRPGSFEVEIRAARFRLEHPPQDNGTRG